MEDGHFLDPIMLPQLLTAGASALLLSAGASVRPLSGASRLAFVRMDGLVEATCAWATDPYSSRGTAAAETSAWVNEENGYLQKVHFQGGVVPTQREPTSGATAPPPVPTCAWATDPYSSRGTVAPPETRAWVNEENGYLQKLGK